MRRRQILRIEFLREKIKLCLHKINGDYDIKVEKVLDVINKIGIKKVDLADTNRTGITQEQLVDLATELDVVADNIRDLGIFEFGHKLGISKQKILKILKYSSNGMDFCCREYDHVHVTDLYKYMAGTYELWHYSMTYAKKICKSYFFIDEIAHTVMSKKKKLFDANMQCSLMGDTDDFLGYLFPVDTYYMSCFLEGSLSKRKELLTFYIMRNNRAVSDYFCGIALGFNYNNNHPCATRILLHKIGNKDSISEYKKEARDKRKDGIPLNLFSSEEVSRNILKALGTYKSGNHLLCFKNIPEGINENDFIIKDKNRKK